MSDSYSTSPSFLSDRRVSSIIPYSFFSMALLPLSLVNQHDHSSLHSTIPEIFSNNVVLSENSAHDETWELSNNVVLSEQSTHEETCELDKQSPEGSKLVNSEAWRFGVETNTLRYWTVVPPECVEYVKSYMLGSGGGSGSQYLSDSHMVANESIAYASSLKLSGDGKDVWIFDVDDTLISSLPYFAAHNYGGDGVDDDEYIEWAALSENPVLPASHRLYSHLLELGFTIFLLTGRYDYERNATEKNLARVGYHSWEGLLMREPEHYHTSAVVYKSEKRMKIEGDGFRIRGNTGDQWSDLTGYSVGDRTFKLPNLLYHVGS